MIGGLRSGKEREREGEKPGLGWWDVTGLDGMGGQEKGTKRGGTRRRGCIPDPLRRQL